MKKEQKTQNPVFVLHSAFIILHFPEWVTDGTRTRDVQDHNLALYQLSYGYRLISAFYRIAAGSQYTAIPAKVTGRNCRC